MLPDSRRYLSTKQFNRPHDLIVRHEPYAHLCEKARIAKQLVLIEYLINNLLRTPYRQPPELLLVNVNSRTVGDLAATSLALYQCDSS
jgi:hypothetical protein